MNYWLFKSEPETFGIDDVRRCELALGGGPALPLCTEVARSLGQLMSYNGCSPQNPATSIRNNDLADM